jgi:hypothetical protein
MMIYSRIEELFQYDRSQELFTVDVDSGPEYQELEVQLIVEEEVRSDALLANF